MCCIFDFCRGGKQSLTNDGEPAKPEICVASMFLHIVTYSKLRQHYSYLDYHYKEIQYSFL